MELDQMATNRTPDGRAPREFLYTDIGNHTDIRDAVIAAAKRLDQTQSWVIRECVRHVLINNADKADYTLATARLLDRNPIPTPVQRPRGRPPRKAA